MISVQFQSGSALTLWYARLVHVLRVFDGSDHVICVVRFGAAVALWCHVSLLFCPAVVQMCCPSLALVLRCGQTNSPLR